MARRPIRAAALLALFASLLLQEGTSHAVPASSRLHTLAQPDGARFVARQWGDEHLSGWETSAGYTVVRDASSGEWRYAERTGEGELAPSPARPDAVAPPSGTPPHLRPAGESLTVSRLRRAARAAASALPEIPPSPSGTWNILVALMKFSDSAVRRGTLSPAGEFERIFFGSGNGSMADYYREVSRGAFTVSSGPAGIRGWITASGTHDHYGRDGSGGYIDVYVEDLVREAARELDRVQLIDFSPYDRDGDCLVDTFAVIYEGSEQSSSGNQNDIWPHKSSITPYETRTLCANPTYTGERIKISSYIIQGELNEDDRITTIGTMTHEFGHSLGLPDLYDTDYSSEGVGMWSLMAAGSYGTVDRSGDSPTHLDPWSKFYLGWVTPEPVTATRAGLAIGSVVGGGSVLQLREGTPTEGEYFLVENRQREGFDRGLPNASGLLIWHIDGAVVSRYYDMNSVNDHECTAGTACATRHLGVALEQADGRYALENPKVGVRNSGIPFPGSSSNRAFGPRTVPSSALYSGKPSGFSVTGIGNSASVMTAGVVVAGDPFSFTTPAISADRPVAYKGKTLSVAFTAPGLSSPQAIAERVVQEMVLPSWVSIAGPVTAVAGKEGEVVGRIPLALAANTDAVPRSGAASMGASSFALFQAAAPCVVTVAASDRSRIVFAEGGPLTVTVTAPGGCAWQASSAVPWITLESAGGTGTGTVKAQVQPNQPVAGKTSSRKGKIAILTPSGSGKSVGVTQSAQPSPL
ncbi:MAG TPA: M6 family metalloprotease domain-containing protein [Verrucomicrobiae bacterium]|nr:M6 family metalloprotease domain-containing protein [Verrucomicrobiae bacterium]